MLPTTTDRTSNTTDQLRQIALQQHRLSDINSLPCEDNLRMEQGISQMTPTAIRPIPKPSIGDYESFVEGTGESFMNGGKTLSMVGVVKNNRYNMSDAKCAATRNGAG